MENSEKSDRLLPLLAAALHANGVLLIGLSQQVASDNGAIQTLAKNLEASNAALLAALNNVPVFHKE